METMKKTKFQPIKAKNAKGYQLLLFVSKACVFQIDLCRSLFVRQKKDDESGALGICQVVAESRGKA